MWWWDDGRCAIVASLAANALLAFLLLRRPFARARWEPLLSLAFSAATLMITARRLAFFYQVFYE